MSEKQERNHEVVTLVGSTKPEWRERYAQVNRELTLAGYAVISVAIFRGDVPDIERHRELLESIHLQKIDMADKVVLISRDAIGFHTQMELQYAAKMGKALFCFDGQSRKLNPLKMK